MAEKETFDRLKEYLKNEYVILSDQKDKLLMELMMIQVEDEKKETPLFDLTASVYARKLFSPFFMKENSLIHDEISENNDEMNKINNSVNDIQLKMDMMKEFLIVLNQYVNEEKKESENESVPVVYESYDFIDMIRETVEFLRTQYDEIEFFMDFTDESFDIDSEFNHNIIRILTYTISSTLETKEVDTVIIDITHDENMIHLILQLIKDDEILDQFDYHFSLK